MAKVWPNCVICGSSLMLKVDRWDSSMQTVTDVGYAFGGYKLHVTVSAKETLEASDNVTDCWCPQCKLKYHVED